MKKLLIALLFFPMLAMAKPTEDCVREHFAAIRLSPKFGYEKDIGIVRIWCQCRWKQEEAGKDEVESMEYCLNDTIDAVNEHLRMTRNPK